MCSRENMFHRGSILKTQLTGDTMVAPATQPHLLVSQLDALGEADLILTCGNLGLFLVLQHPGHPFAVGVPIIAPVDHMSTGFLLLVQHCCDTTTSLPYGCQSLTWNLILSGQ